MKIIKLTAENVMKLSAVEIVPKDNLVLVTGENGAGKSSVLDSIVMALCGKSAIPAEPIKKGANKGKIVVELEMYRIERSFTPGNSYLKIEGVDGSVVKSPQKFLDEIIGKISFDPLEFMNLKPEEQSETFLSLIGVDIKALDKEEAEIYEKRTLVGRDVKKTEVCLGELRLYPEVVGKEEQSAGELSSKLTKAMEFNQSWDLQDAENEKLKSEGVAHRTRIGEIEEEIEKLRKESADCEASILRLKSTYQEKRKYLEANPKHDISQIQTQLSMIDETNEKIRSNNNHSNLTSEMLDLRIDYENYTKQIAAIDDRRKEMLSDAPMPVAGLKYDSGKITYNEIPLSQCSDGEKLMISLGISMALNPTLRVLRIKDGSLLDEKNRKIIYDQIKDKDFQLWMESVSSSKSAGIFIEDGNVVAVDGKDVPVAPAPRTKKSFSDKVKPQEEEKVETKNNESNKLPEIPEDW